MANNQAERRKKRGGTSVTLHEVAKIAGVSAMSVSRLLSGTLVKPEARQRIEAAIAQTGYIPNPAARKLARGENIRLAVLHANPSASFTSQMLIGLVEAASELDCPLKLERVADLADYLAIGRQLARGRPDGIILPPPLCDVPVLGRRLINAEPQAH